MPLFKNKKISKVRIFNSGRRSLIAVLIISLIAGTGAWRVWDTSAAISLYSSSYDDAVHKRINEYRTNRGLRALSEGPCIMRYAKASAARMAKYNSMTHATNLKAALRECGGSAIGENIASTSTSTTPNELCSLWFNSTGHRANMLKASYRTGAVASYKSTRTVDGKTVTRVYTASWFRAP